MQIIVTIIHVTTCWQLWWILHHYQVYNHGIFLKDTFQKKSLKITWGVPMNYVIYMRPHIRYFDCSSFITCLLYLHVWHCYHRNLENRDEVHSFAQRPNQLYLFLTNVCLACGLALQMMENLQFPQAICFST